MLIRRLFFWESHRTGKFSLKVLDRKNVVNRGAIAF